LLKADCQILFLTGGVKLDLKKISKINLLWSIIAFIFFYFSVSHFDIAISYAEVMELEDEEPAFTNIAQVQKAENLSALTAEEPDEEAIAAKTEADQKKQAYEEAKQKLDTLMADQTATQQQIEAARLAVERAKKAYEEAQESADEKLAEFAGVPAEDVMSMRRSGMGWGQIAHELGIHPGALGLGHTKNKQYGYQKSKMKGKYLGETGELDAITGRNLKTGWSKGHGTDLSSHSGGKGHSNGKGKFSGKEKGKGKDKSTGKGNGKKGGKNK
jgi:hypothetical protein